MCFESVRGKWSSIALVLLCFFGSQSAGRAQEASDAGQQSLSKWARALDSKAYESCSFHVLGEAVDSEGSLISRREMRILRRGDWLRVLTANKRPTGETEVFTEVCITDQLLRVRGRESPADPSSMRGTGFLESWDTTVQQTVALGECNILLGLLYMQRGRSARIPQLLAQAEANSIALGEGAELVAEFSPESGLPTSLAYNFYPWPRSDGTLDPSRRDRSKQYSWEYNDLKWGTHEGVSYLQAFDYYIPGVTTVPTRYRVSEIDFLAELSDQDFLPSSSVPELMEVHVRDVPVECEWRDNRIQPVLPAGASSPASLSFLSTPLARFGFILLPAILAGGLYFAYQKLGKT